MIRKNRRTLKKRIIKSLLLSIFISYLFFCSILILIFAKVIQESSRYASRFMGQTIAVEISSQSFLKLMEVKDISEVKKDSPNLNEWKKNLSEKISLNSPLPHQLMPEAPRPFVHDSPEEIKREKLFVMDISIELNNDIIYYNKSKQQEEVDFHIDILENMPDNELTALNKITLWFNKTYYKDTGSSVDIIDSNGNYIGLVKVELNQFILIIILFVFALVISGVSLISILVARLVTRFFSRRITNPLNILIVKMEALASGNLEDALNTPIVLKRPLREIEAFASASNRIVDKVKDYTKTLENQNTELEAMSNDQMETNDRLARKNNHLQNILDNVGQGFLAFGKDLCIYEEYSLQCKRIFGRQPTGLRLSELLYEDIEEQEFINTLFSKVINEEDINKIELYIHLLPEEMKIKNRSISFDYELVNNIKSEDLKSIMVIMTDITEKRSLERKMDEERNVLRMVVKSVVHYDDFLSCVDEYESFCSYELRNILDSDKELKEIISEVFIIVHTFKGSFSQYDTCKVVTKLHELESFLSKTKENSENINKEEFKTNIQKYKIATWLDEDLNILRSYLGEDFFNKRDIVQVDKKRLLSLEEKMLRLLSYDEFKLLLPYFRRLRFKPFKELLSSYPDYVEKLSERLEKEVSPICIEGDDAIIDQDYYRDFTKSLVHIFRNCLDHGIESSEERAILGKNEIGSIKCYVKELEDSIKLVITDDGRGIDIEKVRSKAIEKGILDVEEASKVDEAKLLYMIFKEDFSLKEEITETSGRGMGLYSVEKEILKLKGTVEVISSLSKGTEFIFIIPKQSIDTTPKVSLEDIVLSLSKTGEQFLNNLTGLGIEGNNEINNLDRINLYKLSALITIRGMLQGIIIISFNEALACKLVENFIIDDIVEEEIKEYIEDVVAECSNIILGNSISSFGEFEDLITIGTPTIICYKGASIKYISSTITSCTLKKDIYEASFSYVSTDEKLKGV